MQSVSFVLVATISTLVIEWVSKSNELMLPSDPLDMLSEHIKADRWEVSFVKESQTEFPRGRCIIIRPQRFLGVSSTLLCF